MSVYIKGFPLPNNCGACPLRLAWCRERIYMVTRPERCPLVPVPEHGDLIDRDVLKAKQQEDADLFIDAYTLMEKSRRDEALNAVANIVNAPTIIPASEEVKG